MKPKICLNAIVRNEADKIERMLASVDEIVDCYAITDTGSTDGTPEVIRRHIDGLDKDKPLLLSSCAFENFSQARNYALEQAISWSSQEFDYILLVDADMELQLVANYADPFAHLDGPGYDILQNAGTVVYANRRLMRRDQTGRYVGATHEYLDVPSAGTLPGVFFKDHADGSNRKDKFVRDIALLLADLKRDPNNGRSWYYLGQSYRDAGQHKRAAKAYLRRAEMDGWAEETWSARYNYGHALKASGDEAGFIKAMLNAYSMRPQRAEPLYDLAKYLREQPDQQAASSIFSGVGMQMAMPNDMLFVDSHCYTAGLRDEFSVTAWYDERLRSKGFEVTNDLALDLRVPQHVRADARARLYHYLKPLSDFLPVMVTTIPNPDPEYTALNPSIAADDLGKLSAIVRTVNYRIAEDGSYRIKGDDGSITRDNPIRTRNYLVRLNDDLSVESSAVLPDPLPEPKYDLVRGYEDMRLIRHNKRWFVSAAMREMLDSGMPQQVLAQIGANDKDFSPYVRFDHAMSDGSVCEKNWMPYTASGGIQFMYRLGKLVDQHGKVLCEDDVNAAVENLNGGTQLIPFMGGHLALVHEAYFIPGTCRRYYQHRFVWWDLALQPRHLSLPFVFNDRVIEFAAGMCWHPDGKRLVISYGFKDEEARLATVAAADVREFVFHGHPV